MMTNVTIILAEELWGTHATPERGMVLLANAPWLLVPVLVIARMARTEHSRLKVAGARTTRVLLVRHWLPSGWIQSECGLAVWQRSLAVGVYFPAMDPPHNPVGHCNDCASITFLLSKQARGWTVWGNY